MENNVQKKLAAATVARLRSSIRVKGPLPGLTSAVRLIELAEEKEQGQDTDIVKAVLADPTLVHKVLRLANSTMYASFGGYVDTVSRALLILGTETVAHLAFSQTLLDNLQPAAREESAVATMESAILAGHMARQFSKGSKGKEVETAVICALMHSMGKLLLDFYLPKDCEKLNKAIEDTGASEREIAVRLFGLSLEQLGQETAREWGMPSSILEGLRHIPPSNDETELCPSDRIAAISSLAHQCAETVTLNSAGVPDQERLNELTTSYSVMLGRTPESLLSDLDTASEQAQAERAVAEAPLFPTEEEKILVMQGIPVSLAARLQRAVTDLQARRDTITPGEALAVATDALFEGLGLRRAFVFIRKAKGYSARMGVGTGSQEMLPSLQFDDMAAGEALEHAIDLNRVLYIADAVDPSQRRRLPSWVKAREEATGSVIIIPIVISGKPLGFLYGDWKDGAPKTSLADADFAPIQMLRSALVTAVTKR